MAIHAIATYGDNLSPAETSQRTRRSQVERNALTYSSRHPEQTKETAKDIVKKMREETKYAQTHPSLFLSTIPGATARMYVHVQITRMMTSKSD